MGLITSFQYTPKINSQPQNAIEALNLADKRRVDLVMISDSNGLNLGYGFDSGFQAALSTKYNMYATSIMSANEGSYGVGYKYGASYPGSSQGVSSGATTSVDNLWNFKDLTPHAYTYFTGGAKFPTNNGVSIAGDCPINVNDSLMAHFCYAKISTNFGTFQPAFTSNLSTVFGTVTSNQGTNGQIGYYELPIIAGNRSGGGSNLKWTATSGEEISSDFIALYSRLENPNKITGFSVSPLISHAGKSMPNFAAGLAAMPDETLITYFSEIRRLQEVKGYKPLIILYLNTGVNDRNGSASVGTPTLGMGAYTSGGGGKWYFDNYSYIVKRIQDIYVSKSWDLSGLFFLLVPSHPLTTPEHTDLTSFRSFSKTWANKANIQVIDTTLYVTPEYMFANDWYNGSNGDIHLSEAGYLGIATRIINNTLL